MRDHCHFTGKYRGAAQNSCNLKYHSSEIIPVVFHNLTHFLIKNLATRIPGRVSIITNKLQNLLKILKFNVGL